MIFIWEVIRKLLNRLEIDNNKLKKEENRKIMVKNIKETLYTGYKLLFSGITEEEKEIFYFDDNHSDFYSVCMIISDYYKIPIKTDAKSKRIVVNEENITEGTENIIGARIRKVVLREGWNKNERGVLVAFEEDNKSIFVMIPSYKKGYRIYDIKGKKVMELNSDNIKKIPYTAYSVYKPLPESSMDFNMMMKYVISSINRKDISSIFLFSFIAGLVSLVFPVITGNIVDELIPFSNIKQSFLMLYIFIITTITLYLVKIARAAAIVRVDKNIQYYLQSAIWDRLLKLPVSFFKDYSSGEMSERANGIMEISSKISQVIISSFLSMFFACFYLLLIFYYDFTFALYSAALLFFVMGTVISFSYIKYNYQKVVTELDGKCSSLMFEIINGIEKVRMYAAENHLFMLWSSLFSKKKNYYKKVEMINNFQNTVISITPVIINLFMFWFFVSFNMYKMTTGVFFAFTTALTGFTMSVTDAAISVENIVEAVPLYKRLFPIINSEIENAGEKENIGIVSGKIMLKDVSFRYTQEHSLILNGITFNINPGESVAIVGASGSGKSTLLRLLLGFENLTSGDIMIDNKSIKDIDIKDYRKQIGVVLQDSRLLSGDIYSNIRGNLNISAEEIEEILKKTGIYDEISEMPMGMHTIIDENAKTISEGQKQRLLIARAIAGNPSILFLDEATSSLDNMAQRKIMEMFNSLKITRISIAHRLSTVKEADKIIVLKDGFVNDIGTFNELMEKKGYFYNMTNAV